VLLETAVIGSTGSETPRILWTLKSHRCVPRDHRWSVFWITWIQSFPSCPAS